MPERFDRALAPLGGLPYKGTDGKWRTNDLDGPGDKHGLTLDRFRVIATAMLYQANPKQLVFCIGDPPDAKTSMPSGAKIVQTELEELEVLELDMRWIEAKTTHRQLIGLCAKISWHNLRRIDLISNEWHLGRIRAMIDCSPHLHALRSIDWRAVAAEEVMLKHDYPTWAPVIQQARDDPKTAERIKLEQKGQMQMYAGTYAFAA
jgi:hypothetical protein